MYLWVDGGCCGHREFDAPETLLKSVLGSRESMDGLAAKEIVDPVNVIMIRGTIWIGAAHIIFFESEVDREGTIRCAQSLDACICKAG